jgi:hypothetical protein
LANVNFIEIIFSKDIPFGMFFVAGLDFRRDFVKFQAVDLIHKI